VGPFDKGTVGENTVIRKTHFPGKLNTRGSSRSGKKEVKKTPEEGK